MNAKVNYWVPTLLMAMMLGCIIYLVVVYPAKHFDLTRADVNPDLNIEGSDYKQRKDYTDLELYGRQIYMAEGCFYCHSQQTRYQDRGMGPAAIPQEYQFDAPHLLGSARTGPDLAREGGKYPSRWHVLHHINPRSKSAGSIMPSFKHLEEELLEFQVDRPIDSHALLRMTPTELRAEMKATGATETDRKLTPEETMVELRAIGYTDYDIMRFDGRGVTRLDALVAYIQSLGPNRMYEPGDPVRMYEPQPQPPSPAFQEVKSDSELPAGTTDALTTAGLAEAHSTPGVELLPVGVKPPPDWVGLGDKWSDYWVPTEYQELAAKAAEDKKIPAFEPRFINNGRGIFLGKCAHCHGPNGQGNGPSGRYMMKKPANFWLPQFKQYSDAMWFYRVAEGVPGTEMPMWKKSLRQRKESARWDQIWYLVTYLKYIAKMSPMPNVPADLPPSFYLWNADRERMAIFPIDVGLIEHATAASDAAAKEAKP